MIDKHYMCSTCFYTESKLRYSNWKKYGISSVMMIMPSGPNSKENYCCWCGQRDQCVWIDCEYKYCDGHEEVKENV